MNGRTVPVKFNATLEEDVMGPVKLALNAVLSILADKSGMV